jgi:hypothetical protein
VWPLPDESAPLEPECDDVADEGVVRALEGLSYERLMLRGQSNVERWKRRASLSPSQARLPGDPRRVSVEVVAVKIVPVVGRPGATTRRRAARSSWRRFRGKTPLQQSLLGCRSSASAAAPGWSVRWTSGLLSSESGLSRRSPHRSVLSMVGLALYDRRLQFRVYWTAQVIESSQRRLRHSLKAD